MNIQKNMFRKIIVLSALIGTFFSLNPAYAAQMTSLTQDGFVNTPLTAFQNIDVATVSADIDLEPGMAFAIEILNNKNSPFSYGLENGKLTVRQEKRAMFAEPAYVKIYYPANSQFDSVVLNSASGDIDMEVASIKTLMLSNISGDIDLENVTAENAELKSVSGDISCDYFTSTLSVKGSSISGDIELDGIFNGKTELSSTSGDVDMDINDMQTKYNLSLNSIGGRIFVNGQRVMGDVNQTNAPNSIKISTTSGDVEIEFHRNYM